MITKAKIAAVAAVPLAATMLTACGSHGQQYVSTCVNPLTQIRMADYYCLVGNPYYHPGWLYYMPSGSYVPAYGGHISNYNTKYTTLPKGGSLSKTKVPASGGKVSLNKSSGGTTKGKTGTGTKIKSYFKPRSGKR